ncbi:MAG: hypothetical protein QOJ91_2993 [Sphingomonadales bacterium]|jgi:hypothetical protein|nr:hypothetical protein [Sphingomonadales bacterium]
MIRTVIGGLVAGIIIFVTGFIFWATPLGELAYSKAGDAESAAVQTALAQNLTKTGTGTYEIPYAGTPQGQTLYGNGPIATVHFNTAGFSKEDMGMLLPGFIVAVISGLLIAFGLAAVSGRSFAELARLVVCFSLGFTVWEYLGTPIFNHFGWGFWIYSFIAESVSLILAGLVVARWFVPNHRIEVAETPRATEA